MKLPLFSLQQAPRTLPIWQCILEDLGHPSAPQLARVLGVGVRTVHRWNRAGNAPRVACMALFWLTRWGRSEIDCRATNDAILAAQIAHNLTDRCTRLETQLAHVLSLNDHGAANAPVLAPARQSPIRAQAAEADKAAAVGAIQRRGSRRLTR